MSSAALSLKPLHLQDLAENALYILIHLSLGRWETTEAESHPDAPSGCSLALANLSIQTQGSQCLQEIGQCTGMFPEATRLTLTRRRNRDPGNGRGIIKVGLGQEAEDSPEWHTGDGCGTKPPQHHAPGPPPVDTWESEGSEVQDHPCVYCEFEVSLGYMRPCHKREVEKEGGNKGREGEKGIWKGSSSTGRHIHTVYTSVKTPCPVAAGG